MENQPKPGIVEVSAGTQSGVSGMGFLEEQSRMRHLRRLMLGVATIVLLFLGWSVVAEVDEIAKARSEVLPKARNQLVQSKEGGVLLELLVRKDDRVEAGQVIARFDPTSVLADVNALGIRRAGLSIDIERWGALAEGRSPDFSAFSGSYPALTREGQELFETQRRVNEAVLRGLVEQQERAAATVAELEGQYETLNSEMVTLQDTYDRLAVGVKKGVVPALRVNEARARMLEVRARTQDLKTRVEDVRSQQRSLDESFAEALSNFETEARTERSKLLEQKAEVEAQINAVRGRRGQLDMVSPVTGIIKNVPDTQTGGVIPPGGTVAEIVPTEDGLILEAKVLPRDIGFVREGQPVLAKFDAFDFSRFGSVRGTVSKVSPSSFTDQRTGERYYLVGIDLNQAYVGTDEGNRLVPGMTGEVDIVTGEKSIFRYLLKPVFIGLDSAFHER